MQIVCSDCLHEVLPGTLGRCPRCDGILRPIYPPEALTQLAQIEPGPGIDRYRALLPVTTPLPFLGEGDTPLIPARRLGAKLGLEKLYFKQEGRNPTGAFKDRPAALVAALALEAGVKGVVTASSGNAASAIAAYSAAAGLPCLILLEPGAPPAKLRQTLAVGACVLPVQGLFTHGPAAVSQLITALAERLHYYPAFVWAPVNPYILEALKTIAYEIVARLPGAPDVVVCPVGGGDLFTGIWRGFVELHEAGLIEKLPRMIAVQTLQAPPLLNAFLAGERRVPTLPAANSQVSGINVPFSGEHALAAVRASGGVVIGVADEAVFAMQQQLAMQEGLWAEPAGAAPAAALQGLLRAEQIAAGERVVCLISSAGFKDAHLAEAQALAVGQQAPVAFGVDEIVNEFTSTR